MAFVNNYHEPEPVTVDYKVVLDPAIPYDFNCYYTGGELGNDRVKLVPFVVSRTAIHLRSYSSQDRATARHFCRAIFQPFPRCTTGLRIPALRTMADA